MSTQSSSSSLFQRGAAAAAAALPHLRAVNARLAEWVLDASWKKLILLALLTLITMAIIGGVLGIDEPVVRVESGTPVRNVRLDVRIDGGALRVTPSLDDRPGKTLSVPLEVSVTPAPGAAALHAAIRSAVEGTIEDARDEIEQMIDQHNRGARSVRRERVLLWDIINAMLIGLFAWLVMLKIIARTNRDAAERVRSAAGKAERESLQRQVVEARMQMMQAQVEPHFLFNTLASVDYLIETDPARASTMQKNLIQYLRAALPQMRENATQLGREVDLVRAYLDILKVRMEERLQLHFDVPDGLRSADFPPMMLQSLVENAIRHGLEPKPEGGALTVAAQIVDGDLCVTVADTGLGLDAAQSGAPSSAGTGLGLTNIRERLQLLHPGRGQLVLEANRPCGTRATLIVPYLPRPKAAP